MSLQTLMNIAGSPGMDVAVSLAVDLAAAVQNVKIYRRQCMDLSDRCTRLLLAFREKCSGLEGTEFITAADEVCSIIERAHKKAQSWATMSRIRSFVYQNDIKLGLEQLYRDIDICAQQFSIASSAELHRGHRELQAIRERDIAENREVLQNILRSVDSMRDVMALNEPNAVQHLMQTIQEELQQQSVLPDQQRDLQRGLYEIHRETNYLPPMIDLTGQVVKTSDQAVAYGAYNDVYTGLWLNEEKVALKFARAFNHTAKARKRFHKEVEIWRDLQHPNVSRLFGIVYFGSQIYSVSAWMENGDAFNYINSTEEIVDRLKILLDAACGMEYLHLRNVVHGDLRAANILVDDKGRACVSDFGLSKVIEEVAPDISSSANRESPIRWQARELVKPDDYGGLISVSKQTDVWSFGMTCLEILTGNRPYNNRPRDANVIEDLVAKRLPERPTDPTVVARGLSDQLWSLIGRCWRWDPLERPTMTVIRESMKSFPPSVTNASLVIPNHPLSESPKAIPADLAQGGNVSSTIPKPKASVPYALGFSPTLPNNPLYRYNAAGKAVTNATSPGLGRFRGESVSSMNSNSSDGLGATGKRRPSTSSSLMQHTLAPFASSNNGTTGALGLIFKERGTISERLNNPLNPMQATGHSSRPGSRDDLLLSNSQAGPSHQGISPPSTDPKFPINMFSGISASPESPKQLSSLRFSASDLLSEPPVVTVDDGSGGLGAVSTSLPDSLDRFQPFRRRPSFLMQSSLPTHSSPHRHGNSLLSSPPLGIGDERIESEMSGESISSSIPSSLESPLRPPRSSSSSDPTSSKSSLTDFSNLNCHSVIHFTDNGRVRAGTLAGFVDRLIKDTPGTSGYAKDQEFREMFLTTYRLFASSKDIIRLLIRRFVNASAELVENRVHTQYLVLSVLKQWLRGHYARSIDVSMLEDLKLFLADVTSAPLLDFSRELITLIDDLVVASRARVRSPTVSSIGKQSIRVSEISPTALAIALTVLEGGKYKAITATDCISHLLGGDGVNNVAEARATNNKIVNWVKKSIIRSDRMENRGDTLRFFVNTAAECRTLHNYSSMSALLAGIDSPTVMRLKLTRGCLDKQMREVQKKLSGVFDPSHNHRAYRDIIPDPNKKFCVPWLAVQLKDLQSVYERHQREIAVDGRLVINFEKYTRVYESISTMLAFQKHINDKINIESERKAGPFSYLEKELASTALGQAAEDKLEARSAELQKQEDRDYEYRVNELAAVGFKTSRGRG